jgi:hypothetical protein
LRSLVTERLKPLCDRLLTIGYLVSENLDHEFVVAYKLHVCNDGHCLMGYEHHIEPYTSE